MAQNTRRNQSTTRTAPAKQAQEKLVEEAIVEEADDTTQAAAGSTAEDTTEIVTEVQGGGESEVLSVEPSASADPDPELDPATVPAEVAAPGGLLAKFVDPTTDPVEAAAVAAPPVQVKPTGTTIDAGEGEAQAIVIADVYSLIAADGSRVYARKGDVITTTAKKVNAGIANRLLRSA